MTEDSEKDQKVEFVHRVTFPVDFRSGEEYQQYLIEIGNEILKQSKPFIIVTDGEGVSKIIGKE